MQCLFEKQPYAALNNPQIVGPTFARLRPSFYTSSLTLDRIRDIESLASSEEAWQMALAVLSPSRLRKSNEQRPLPSRRILSLEKSCEVGPPVEIQSVDDLLEQYGFSGVEVGNYVSNAESMAMQNWLAQLTHDLRQIVGPCLVRLHRREPCHCLWLSLVVHYTATTKQPLE